MADFLLELLTEEIPARMQAKAADDLGRLFAAALGKHGLTAEIETHVTPRRLALIARGLPLETEATTEERRGPRADAPAPAIEGFLRSTGLPREALEERDDPKGRFLYAVLATPGRRTADVLPAAVTEAVTALPWPKSMRWGEASTSMDSPRWVRPLTSVIALLDTEIVPLEVLGLPSGRTTRGHRFIPPPQGEGDQPQAGGGASAAATPIAIDSPATYAAQLRAAHVILSAAERRAIITEGARAAAHAAGLTLIEDEPLVAENAGLTEWPVPLLGHFDPAFLEVPREVIQLTMRTNQKYFACTVPPPQGEGDQPQAGGGAGSGAALAPAFICVANLQPADGGARIVEGNRRVLAARLSDARFFWEQDKAQPLEAYLPRLEQVVFHEKLGTMRDKAERIAKLARWLVESGAIKPTTVGPDLIRASASSSNAAFPSPTNVIPGSPRDPASSANTAEDSPVPDQVRDDAVEKLATLAERAGRLSKVDLVTSAVGEFPELQGLMGGYYAQASGEDPQVAAAIRDHYKPVGPSDAVPTAPVTVAVSLADKLMSLVGFFAAGELPSGSRDPFALRRAIIAIQTQTLAAGCRYSFSQICRKALDFVASGDEDGERWLWGYKALNEAEMRKHPVQAEAGVSWAPQTRVDAGATVSALLTFFADRLKVQQREAGVRHDLIDAVFALGNEDDLVRLLARVHALQAFITTPEGEDLLAAYRRAANILRAEDHPPPTSATEVPAHQAMHHAETTLESALKGVLGGVSERVSAEDFAGAMGVLATLRAPVDQFFTDVMVNDKSPEIRAFRLSLLARFVAAAHTVADFSKIEG